MRIRKATIVALGFILIGVILGLTLSSSLDMQVKGYSKETMKTGEISQEAIDFLTKAGRAMAEVAEAVKPSVVNISTTRTIKQQVPDIFNDPFFRRFFGEPGGGHNEPLERKTTSLGSGVIVDKAGYILTNNHVIQGADDISVTLSDNREFKGKVIGSDPKSDLAVIKIEDSENLPAIKWGDSDKLRVGETVIAIGNPYGLNQTVTSGIVSAVGRANVGIADYEDFIQTDAAINPGNSGGALVNARGELIGINTAIFSRTGGFQGIGFAIPTNMGRKILDSLIEKGKVVRGWLGVYIQPLTDELAKQFDLASKDGALISDVIADSPAEKAGMERGDFVFEYDGKKIASPTELRNMVAATAPGNRVDMKLIRNGAEKTIRVLIGELPETMEVETPSAMEREYDNALKGVAVHDLTDELRQQMDVPSRVSGVLVTSVEGGSPTDGKLGQNDIIREINRKRIKSVKDYEAIVSKIKPDENVLLLVYRQGYSSYITISPDSK